MHKRTLHCQPITRTPELAAVSGSNFQALLQFVTELLSNLSLFLRSSSWGISFKDTTTS